MFKKIYEKILILEINYSSIQFSESQYNVEGLALNWLETIETLQIMKAI